MTPDEQTGESKLGIIDAFGAPKYACTALHQTDGILRLTVNGVNYDCCPQCFGTWLTNQFPVHPL